MTDTPKSLDDMIDDFKDAIKNLDDLEDEEIAFTWITPEGVMKTDSDLTKIIDDLKK